MTTADALLAYLRAKGVDRIFFVPGGGAMHLNDALARSEIGPVHCHHEQACGIAAEAWGRVRGHAGVAMVTTGPGATNILTPVAGAWIESTPLVVVSGQVKRADLKAGTGVRQRGAQEVDVVAMAATSCKFATTVMSPEEALRSICKAWHLANSGRMGPCWVDVPLDVQGAPYPGDWAADAARFEKELLAAEAAAQAPVPAQWAMDTDALLAAVSRASRPVLLVGHGVRLAGCAQRLVEVMRRHEIPAVFTWNAMDMLEWDDPLNAGRPGAIAQRCANLAVQRSDLLITIGARMDNVVTAYNPRGFARNAQKIVFDIDTAELAKLEGAATHRWQATAEAALAAVDAAFAKAETRPADRRPWLSWIADVKRRFPARDGAKPAAKGPIESADVAHELSTAVPEGALVVTGSSGLCVESFYLGFRNRAGQRVFLTSGLGAMGYGLAAAIGACEAQPGRRAVLVESDGSLMMNLQELATLRARAPDLAIVLMDNAGYASIRLTQRNYFKGRHVGTGGEAGVLFPDWRATCGAFGIAYDEVDDLANVGGALARLMDPKASGPRLLRVGLVKDEALWPRCASLPQPDGSMLSMPLEDMTPLLPIDVLREWMGGEVAPASLAARGL
ncbi:thiamine pyrophosphate-binding protein [Ramlibacter sp. GTP1]|uniref:Thiamine pyrophosphate-binding protein n=2 Tax=Ramlibacter albus TaxID=2079448 RepID=A0A923M4D0_9BURK|nr:thiamine pyrophosphate-binding protein [Ramlibacter albus]